MKTLTLLACICALTACFSLCEGWKKQGKIHHKRNNVQQYTLDRRLPTHLKFHPNWNILIQKHLIFGPHRYPKRPNPNRRKPKPTRPQPPKCPTKTNTVVSNSTSEANTQIPSLSPITTSNKIVKSPGVTSTNNVSTISQKEDTNTGPSAATPSTQPSPALPDTTAAPPTSSLTTPAPQPSSPLLDHTTAPNTTPNPSPTTPASPTSKTTTAPTTQTTTPATTLTTTVEQTTSPSSQNANSQFWQYIYELIKYISGITPKK
ncbi:mucin-7 [Canis lupus familiaris]|uniref:mucin-7 n=1 Tax=Canis lupus familiaris TaxID=9615 RepID=UPI0018F7431E|nr:mucin-7 [Canis lupus familiaris]XP_038541766.1 mucin-7 [Canis lupus familiaris]